MLEADHSMTSMAMNNGMRFSQEADSKVYAEFMMHPRENPKKSREAGRPVYDEVPYVRIMAAGDKDNIVMRPIRETDKQRFPRQWQAFQNKEEQTQEGTPLSEWAGISRAQIEELRHFNIRTVEALANAPDANLQKFMGINALKQKAKAYMEDAKLLVPIERLNNENAALRQQLDELKAQVNAMQSGDEAEKPKRRRRTKAEIEADDGEIQVDQ